MCVCVRACVCVCLCVHACVCVCIGACLCMLKRGCVMIQLYMYMRACMHVCVCVRACVRVCVCTEPRKEEAMRDEGAGAEVMRINENLRGKGEREATGRERRCNMRFGNRR